MPPMTEPASIEAKVKEALAENGLLILFRVRNSRADYSIMNRPDPTLSDVADHWLATAIVDAVRRFPMKRTSRFKREAVKRDDGRVVTYKDRIDIDWEDEVVHTTASSDLTKQVLSVVVQNLMANAEQQMRQAADERASKDRAN